MRRPTKDPYARPAIQTLERLHAELGGKILENKQEHENLAGQMRHVEAVIKMLDPSYSLRAISVKRRQPNPWFKRGTVYRRAVDVLRTAEQPLTAREIAERVLATANIAKPNKAIEQIIESMAKHDAYSWDRRRASRHYRCPPANLHLQRQIECTRSLCNGQIF